VPPAAGQQEAASDAPAASDLGWAPPLPGSSRDRNRAVRADGPTGGPGMPTDVIPPWANAPRH
jgi:hypothetical protein